MPAVVVLGVVRESKLEYDRRHLRRRIDALSLRLKELEARRGENRRARQKSGVPVISLVGYTNVGKSSLLNRLCGSDVLEANMLFATLDPTARKLTLPSGLAVVVVDTVGFVSRLPHHLVQAFQSTLEETSYSDIIIKLYVYLFHSEKLSLLLPVRYSLNWGVMIFPKLWYTTSVIWLQIPFTLMYF